MHKMLMFSFATNTSKMFSFLTSYSAPTCATSSTSLTFER